MQALREFLVVKYPTAVSLKESDIADSSFIDELERSGFIDRLYAADTKQALERTTGCLLLAHRVDSLRCESSDAIGESGHAENVGSGSI
jgi:hypothetical protein